jgi:hypothetical protein
MDEERAEDLNKERNRRLRTRTLRKQERRGLALVSRDDTEHPEMRKDEI